MSRSRKILLAVAGLAALLIVIPLVLVMVLVDVDDYRGMIEEQAEAALGRDVRLGEMQLSLFPLGVRVDDIGVAALPEEGGGDLLTAGSLRVGARLLPLLSKRLEITGITVERPSMVLVRDADGNWNVLRLIVSREDTTSEEIADETGSEESATLESFAVDSIRLTDGRVTLRDASLVPGTTFEASLEDLDVRITDLAVDRAVGIELSAGLDALPGASLAFDGRVGPVQPPEGAPFAAAGEIRLSKIEPGRLAALLNEAGLLESVPSGFLGDDPLDIEGRVDASRTTTGKEGSRLDLRTLEVDLAGTFLALSGTVDESGEVRSVDMALLPSRVRADHIVSLLALLVGDVPVAFESPSPVEIEATVRGIVSEQALPDVQGKATLKDFTFSHPALKRPVEQVRATVSIGNDRVDLTGFGAVVGSSDASGELHVVGFERPQVTFGLRSEHADFFELFSFLESAPADPGEAAPTGTDTEAAEQMARDLTIDGNLEIVRGSFDTLDFTDLRARMKWSDGVLQLEPCTMKLYDGDFSGRLVAQPLVDPPRFDLRGSVAEVDLGAVLKDNLELEDVLTGRFTGEVSGAGAGAEYESVIRALQGQGTVHIDAGRVGGLDVLGTLSTVTGLFGEDTLGRLSGQLATEGTDFSRMTGDALVSDGVMRLQNLLLETPEFDLRGRGTVNLLSQELDSDLEIVFSDAVSRAMKAEGSRAGALFFNPRSGRVEFPFTMSGPYTSPSPGIDFESTLSTVAERVAEQELRDALGERLGLPTGDAAGGGQTPAAQLPRTPASSGAGPGGLEAAITRLRWDESVFERTLKLGGVVRGERVDHATLIVVDAGGGVLKRTNRIKEVDRWLKRTSDPTARAEIKWKAEIDGATVDAAKLPVSVTLQVFNTSGESVEVVLEIE